MAGCIAIHMLYCDWKGCRRQNRIAIQNCIVTGGMGARQALGAGAGCARRWASGRRALARGTAGALQAGKRAGRVLQGARGARGRERAGRAARAAGVLARGRAERCDTAEGPGHDTARPPTTRPRARGLCAQAGPAGPVLVLVHLAQFSTWFFDSVFFLSH